MKNFRLENLSPIFAYIPVNNSPQTTGFVSLSHIYLGRSPNKMPWGLVLGLSRELVHGIWSTTIIGLQIINAL